MKITKEFLALGLSASTLNQKQCELLSISYPLEEEWENFLLGKEISLKQTNLFLFLRGKLAIKAQEQIVKNYELVAEFHHKPKVSTSTTTTDILPNSLESEALAPKKARLKPSVPNSTRTLTQEGMIIYCDGACSNNPGKAGSGLAIYDEDKEKPTLLYGEYETYGTNNTAELNALYKALLLASKLPKTIIYSDSRYSIDCITVWANGWKKNGWKKKKGEIKNLELIKEMHLLYEKIKKKIAIKHVKGHSGVEGNELADRMASYAIRSKSKEYKEYSYSTKDEVLDMEEG